MFLPREKYDSEFFTSSPNRSMKMRTIALTKHSRSTSMLKGFQCNNCHAHMLSIELRRREGGETGGVMRPNLLLPLSLLRRSEATYFSLSFNAFSSPTKAPPTNERSKHERRSEGASPFRVTVNLSGFRSWLILLRSVAAATKRRPSYILHLMPLLYVFP